MKRPWVVKAGGELVVSGPIRKRLIRDLIGLRKKHPIVFVHGGGPQIEQELLRNKIPTQFVGGRRFTSIDAMTHVERILSGEINKGLAAELSAHGAPALGLSCRDGRTVIGNTISGLGRAATPKHVNAKLLITLLSGGFLPVLSSVGSDNAGAAVNINADDVASAIAIALKAENLIFLTNISGVLDQTKKRIPVLKTSRIDFLIAAGVITRGMIPKVQSARSAIKKGVGEVDIVNGTLGINFRFGTRICE